MMSALRKEGYPKFDQRKGDYVYLILTGGLRNTKILADVIHGWPSENLSTGSVTQKGEGRHVRLCDPGGVVAGPGGQRRRPLDDRPPQEVQGLRKGTDHAHLI